MSGKDFERAIEAVIGPDERAEDIETMIDILAVRRSEARNGSIQDEEGIGAKIICILFDPGKLGKYSSKILQVRRSFGGIADDLNLQSQFEKSISPILLQGDLVTIFKTPVNQLFTGTPEPRASV
jgi:hypothetical protein